MDQPQQTPQTFAEFEQQIEAFKREQQSPLAVAMADEMRALLDKARKEKREGESEADAFKRVASEHAGGTPGSDGLLRRGVIRLPDGMILCEAQDQAFAYAPAIECHYTSPEGLQLRCYLTAQQAPQLVTVLQQWIASLGEHPATPEGRRARWQAGGAKPP